MNDVQTIFQKQPARAGETEKHRLRQSCDWTNADGTTNRVPVPEKMRRSIDRKEVKYDGRN